VIVRAVLALVALASVFVASAAPARDAGSVWYSGTIRFRAAEASNVTLAVASRKVTVSLGPGHVSQAEVKLRRVAGTLRFSAPGLPKPIAFVLKPKGKKLTGTASQGAARATVTLTRGRRSVDTVLGYYGAPRVEVVRFTRHGFDTLPFLVDMATGEFSSAPAAVGARLAVRQFDVRFPNGKTTLTGTLTIPPGSGTHPGVVYVSGSGDTLREEAHWLDALFVSHGIAVLAYDKRGVGQSGGVYPGDLASTETIATLAGDAAFGKRSGGKPVWSNSGCGAFGNSAVVKSCPAERPRRISMLVPVGCARSRPA
jgi:hypothetical protein